MDEVTEKRIDAATPKVASGANVPQSESLVFFSKNSDEFIGSASSSDLSDASWSFSSSSSVSNEPLNDFSEMLAQLPIK